MTISIPGHVLQYIQLFLLKRSPPSQHLQTQIYQCNGLKYFVIRILHGVRGKRDWKGREGRKEGIKERLRRYVRVIFDTGNVLGSSHNSSHLKARMPFTNIIISPLICLKVWNKNAQRASIISTSIGDLQCGIILL